MDNLSKKDFEDKLNAAIEDYRQWCFGKFSVSLPDPEFCYEGDNLSSDFLEEMKKYKSSLEQHMKSVGVFSLSSNPNNTTMWSHYAEDHTGICIGYKPKEILKEGDLDQILHEVSYVPNEEINFSVFDLYTSSLCGKNSQKLNKMITNVIATKTDDWEYEKEWRMVTDKEGLYAYESSAMDTIFFGLRCTRDTKVTIRNILSDVPMLFYQMVRSKSGLGLVAEHMTPDSKYWRESPK